MAVKLSTIGVILGIGVSYQYDPFETPFSKTVVLRLLKRSPKVGSNLLLFR